MAKQSSAVNQLSLRDSGKYNFFYSFRPIYYFSRLFGFMPFTINYHSNGTIQGPVIRSLDIVWLITSICFYFVSAILTYTTAPYHQTTESAILSSGDDLILISGLIFGIFIIIMDWCNRFKLVNIQKNIHTFDEEASQSMQNKIPFAFHYFLFHYKLQTTALGIQFDYKKDYRRLWQFNVVCIVLSLLSVASSYDAFLYFRRIFEAYDFVHFYIPACLENFVVVQISITFTILLRCLHVRFAMLNKCLRYFHIESSILYASVI